jgi:hypothetical protein
VRLAPGSLLLPIVAAMLLGGCGNDRPTWKEEVKLGDGRTVVLDRRAERAGRQLVSGERGPVVGWELCYAPQKVYWKSLREYRPSAFEMAGDKAFVKVLLHSCEMCAAAGSPPDSAVYFAHRDGKWMRVPAAEYPGKAWKNLMEMGIFDMIDPKADVGGSLTLADKWKRDNINEDTREGKFIAADHPRTCSQCKAGATPAAALEPSSTPSDGFCK